MCQQGSLKDVKLNIGAEGRSAFSFQDLLKIEYPGISAEGLDILMDSMTKAQAEKVLVPP